MAALESKLEAAGLPPEASKAAMRDFARLKRMQPSQPEYTVRTRLFYLYPFCLLMICASMPVVWQYWI